MILCLDANYEPISAIKLKEALLTLDRHLGREWSDDWRWYVHPCVERQIWELPESLHIISTVLGTRWEDLPYHSRLLLGTPMFADHNQPEDEVMLYSEVMQRPVLRIINLKIPGGKQ